MFLYLLDRSPREITKKLNRTIKVANSIGLPVISYIYTLNGDYESLEKMKLYDRAYRIGFSFMDNSGYNLIFPPLLVRDNKVFEMSYGESDVKVENFVSVPKRFKKIRKISKRLIGFDKSVEASSSCRDAVKLLQHLENSEYEKIVYIPHIPSCQNVVDGPLQMLNGKLIVVDWSGVFRAYSDYKIIVNNSSINEIFHRL